jgi:hypothetical protein
MKSMTLLLASAAALALAACEQKAPEPPPVELGPDTAEATIPTIASDPSQGDGGVAEFYNLAGPAPARPGTLIRTEAQPAETSLADAGQAMRILYSSTNGLDGKTVAVSGRSSSQRVAPADGFPLMRGRMERLASLMSAPRPAMLVQSVTRNISATG